MTEDEKIIQFHYIEDGESDTLLILTNKGKIYKRLNIWASLISGSGAVHWHEYEMPINKEIPIIPHRIKEKDKK
jgi:hypothetical protein